MGQRSILLLLLSRGRPAAACYCCIILHNSPFFFPALSAFVHARDVSPFEEASENAGTGGRGINGPTKRASRKRITCSMRMKSEHFSVFALKTSFFRVPYGLRKERTKAPLVLYHRPPSTNAMLTGILARTEKSKAKQSKPQRKPLIWSEGSISARSADRYANRKVSTRPKSSLQTL